MAVTDYKLQAWTLPSKPPFEPVVVDVPWENFSFGEGFNRIQSNQAELSSGFDRLTEIIDPTTSTETVLRLLKRDNTEVGNFIVKDAHRAYKSDTNIRLSGPQVSDELRFATVYPYDWIDAFTEVKVPDWEWGSPNTLLKNPSLEDQSESSTSWETGTPEGWEETSKKPTTMDVIEDPAEARTGDYVMKIDAAAYHSGMKKSWSGVPAGSRITITVWLRSPTTGRRFTAGISVGSGYTAHHANAFTYKGWSMAELGNVPRNPAANGTPGGSSNGAWQSLNLDVTLGSDQTSFTVQVIFDHHSQTNGPIFYVDDFEISGGGLGFEPWVPRNATFTIDSSYARHGSNSLKVVTDGTGANADGLAQEDIEGLEIGALYTLGFWVTHGAGSPRTLTAVIRDDNTGSWLANAQTVVASALGTWTYVSVTWTATQPNVRAELRVNSTSALTFYMDTASFATGWPHTTIGNIIQLLLIPIQNRGVLNWMKTDGFNAGSDWSGIPWANQEVSVRVQRGRSLRQAFQLLEDYGLEWDVAWNTITLQYELRCFEREYLGTNKTELDDGKIMAGSGFQGAELFISGPGANKVLAEGESHSFAEVSDNSRITAYGRRESYKGDTSYMSNAQDVAVEHQGAQLAHYEVRARFKDEDGIDQWDKYQMGDRFVVDLPPDINEEELRVASKRITGSRGEEPIVTVNLIKPIDVCLEPYLTGNVAVNPGAENGVVGALLPYFLAPISNYSVGFAQATSGAATAYRFSDVSVRSGSQSLRLDVQENIGSGPHYLYFVRGKSCSPLATATDHYSARVNPGDTAEFKFWARTEDTFSATSITRREWTAYDEDFNYVDGDFDNTVLTLGGTWTQYSYSWTVPAGAYYVVGEIRCSTGASGSTPFSYFDDFEFLVTP